MTFFVANFIIISLRFKGEREMIAAIINAVGIVIGGTLGTLFRGRINDRFTNTLMAAMGLVIVGLGVQGAVGSNNTLCVVVSLALGAIIG